MATFESHLHDLDIDLNQPLSESQLRTDARLMASYELRRGMHITEQPFDTIPAVLQLELLEVQSRKRRSWMDDEEVNPFTGRG